MNSNEVTGKTTSIYASATNSTSGKNTTVERTSLLDQILNIHPYNTL